MEFRFELALCAALESPDRVVARQLGAGIENPGGRIVDVCVLTPGPGFDRRAAITPDRIPDPAIEAAVGPGEAVPLKKAFDLPPDRAEAVAERAAEVGYLERERRDGRPIVRATARYPDDWVGSLTAIENKPDLGTPGDLGSSTAIRRRARTVRRGRARDRLLRHPCASQSDPRGGRRLAVRSRHGRARGRSGVDALRTRRARRRDSGGTRAPDGCGARRPRREGAKAPPDRRARLREGMAPGSPGCAHASTTADGRPHCNRFDRIVDPGATAVRPVARTSLRIPATDRGPSVTSGPRGWPIPPVTVRVGSRASRGSCSRCRRSLWESLYPERRTLGYGRDR